MIKQLLSFIPRPLPKGRQEFEKWADEIIALSGLPNNASMKFTLAVNVLHLDSTTDKKPYRFFVKQLNKGAANQVVSVMIQELKEKQQEEFKAAQAEAEEKLKADIANGATIGEKATSEEPSKPTTEGSLP